jgi:hypothetical protein
MQKTQVTKMESSIPDFLNKDLAPQMIELKKKEFFIKNILGAKKRLMPVTDVNN